MPNYFNPIATYTMSNNHSICIMEINHFDSTVVVQVNSESPKEVCKIVNNGKSFTWGKLRIDFKDCMRA